MEVDLLALEPKPEGTKDPPGGGAPTHKTATFCAMIDLFFCYTEHVGIVND